MIDKNINVCVACDNNYSKYAGVVIASVLANSNEDENLSFYILDGGIEQSQKDKILELKSIKDCNIEFINIDESLFDEYKKVKTHAYITLSAYYRLKLPSLLPNVNRIIYFDCDFIINSSLLDLFNTKLEESPIAGVRDIDLKKVKKNSDKAPLTFMIFTTI